MALIQMITALVILTIIYSRMVKREAPSPVGKKQAVLPVVLGVVSTPLSFVFFLGISFFFYKTALSLRGLPVVLRSVLGALLQAGIPEEAAKLLMILLAVRICRKDIRNVYEYILIGAAVGFGFTLFEEFLYGSEDVITLAGRLFTVAGHMIFGMIMAKHFGMARYENENRKKEYRKAILVPLAVHTLYDACTADNFLMASDNDMIMLIGLAFSIASVIALFVIQLRMLKGFKTDTDKYCSMVFEKTTE